MTSTLAAPLKLLVGVITLTYLSAFSQIARGEDDFWDNQAEGYYWYYDPTLLEAPPPEIAAPEPPAPVITPMEAAPGPPPLSAAWLRENLPKVMDRALDTGTYEDARAYLYLQKLMQDKASVFADNTRLVVATTPDLDENTRRPISTAGSRTMDDTSRGNTEDLLKRLARTMGIWFFYQSTCEFCEQETAILENFQRVYGFEILPIALDGLPLPGSKFTEFKADQGQAAQLGVSTTPTLALMNGDTGEVVIVAEGFQTATSLAQKIILNARFRHWIEENDYEKTLPVTRISMLSEPEQLNNLPPGTSLEEVMYSVNQMLNNKAPQGVHY